MLCLFCSDRAGILSGEKTSRPSLRTVMSATCPLCREPAVRLDSAAWATSLSSQNGRGACRKISEMTSSQVRITVKPVCHSSVREQFTAWAPKQCSLRATHMLLRFGSDNRSYLQEWIPHVLASPECKQETWMLIVQLVWCSGPNYWQSPETSIILVIFITYDSIS